MLFSVLLPLAILVQGSVARHAMPPVSELMQKLHEQKASRRGLYKRDALDLEVLYPEHNLSVPIDHFHNETRYEPHSNGTYDLRYWFDASHYKPGGPVIVLESGETSGVGRLPFLQKGIVAQLAEATGGVGVILEHRYYGTSFPTPDLSTANMRFLTTEQGLADVAYFATHVKFPGVNCSLTAPDTPWIVYGGSYPGAMAAFLRVLYPEIFFGAISSSGVTEAIYDYWEYFEPIRQFAPPDCVSATQHVTHVVDNILLNKNNTGKIQQLKAAYGLSGVTDNRDFANVLTGGIYNWQSTNWDPEENSPEFYYYCRNMTTKPLYNQSADLRESVKDLLVAGGYGSNPNLENIMLNSIGYFNLTSVSRCKDSTQDECFSTQNATFYAEDDLNTYGWRSWNYQVCTEWGYIQTGNTPKDILPLISRTLDVEYLTSFCQLSFNINSTINPPDVDRVNKYGGFNISYPRLAIIGGEADPWKPATPLADNAPKRNSTTEEPVLLITGGAVHHWDENGLFPNETTPTTPPSFVVWAQQFEKNFVVDWLKEWKKK
ncbi:peptidase S28 [Delitschia confertaspora ATCC 74209]|uniref:Peptidase S28 n=1 Tax=Delitschia confertaspora ATCC 74209 TaxID=1513339 RepID=A0A9P4MPH5_9PLEO|nr:peptidase S28 [Delitschia confertaspora ATCC 74209]